MVKSLETVIAKYINSLPYWGQYICNELLSGKDASDEGLLDTPFSCLLEELNLKKKTEKKELILKVKAKAKKKYNKGTILKKLSNVTGVNALTKNQSIEFADKLTILYGSNSAGKSGYVRLLKNAFYSKDKCEILGNIKKNENTEIQAEFFFNCSGRTYTYPNDKGQGEFQQLSVFDNVICKKHLCDRNNFSFRPAGLVLFSDFNVVLDKLGTELDQFIKERPVDNIFAEEDIFQGNSEIKQYLSGLSAKSNLYDLKEKHLPFTKEDKKKKEEAEKKYDDYKIAVSQKESELKKLRSLSELIERKDGEFKNLKQLLDEDNIIKLNSDIEDCNKKRGLAQREGVEQFQTTKIDAIGTQEWKNFIISAEKLAQKQKSEKYPKKNDYCLLCQQPIKDTETQNLIENYWKYINSVAEKQANEALDKISKYKEKLQNINFDLFPDTDTLTVWLEEKHKEKLDSIKEKLQTTQEYIRTIVTNIEKLDPITVYEYRLDFTETANIKQDIDKRIESLKNEKHDELLSELATKKIYYQHKEKLQQRIADIETLHRNMQDVEKAKQFNKQHWKTLSTNTEKNLSKEFFSKNYIDAFNNECEQLDGNFGIDIDARSSEAKSNRQLFLKGNDPSLILSEGEQKVIALADFIAENTVSEINTGLIFDDPVTSLDEERKGIIAKRIVDLADKKQVVVFTHDLVFVSNLVNYSEENNVEYRCHWVEKNDDSIGTVWLDNSPSFENKYKNSGIAQDFYVKAKKSPPETRESLVKSGFAALRSSYEAFVIFDLFSGVVQRFNDRVSIDSLDGVHVDKEIINKISDAFALACRYMEGHNHSDKYAAKKPTPDTLNEEIQRFNSLKREIKEYKKSLESKS